MEDLTNQERKFVKNVIETGNNTKAVIKSFPDIKSKKYARVKAHRLITKDNIKNAIQTIADALPDDELIKVHKEGLKATKRSGTGGMKIGIGTDGKVNDFGHTEIDEPDYATRHKYLDSAYKIKGTYAPDRNLNVNVNIDGLTDEEKENIRKLFKK